MPDVNTKNLDAPNVNLARTIADLHKLANSTKGPLRIKIDKNGEPCIGIRSWPTYFFEKIFCVDTQIEKIEEKTKAKITETIAPFLKFVNSEGSSYLKTRTIKDSEAIILNKLYTKVEERNLNPNIGKTGKSSASTTTPQYNPFNMQLTRGRPHDGMLTVPMGLSVGDIPIEKVVANLRLVPESIASNAYYHFIKIPTKAFPEILVDETLEGEDYYSAYYDKLFKEYDSEFQGSIAIELAPGSNGCVPAEHSRGAYTAAAKFIKKRSSEDNSISILLCGKDLTLNLNVSPDKKRCDRLLPPKAKKMAGETSTEDASPLLSNKPSDRFSLNKDKQKPSTPGSTGASPLLLNDPSDEDETSYSTSSEE